MTHTTKENLTSTMLDLSQYKQAKIYFVAQQASCPLWVALDYLIAEEWDEHDALTSIRGDRKDTH